MAAHQVDPNNEEAPPGVLVVDNNAPAAPGALLNVDSLGDDKQAGDSQFIAPRPEVDQLQGDGQEGLDAPVLLRSPPVDAGQDHGQVAARFRSIARGLAAAALPALAAVLAPGRRARRDPRRVGRGRPADLERRPQRPRRDARDDVHPRPDDLPHRGLPPLHQGLAQAGHARLRAPRGRDPAHRPADPRARRRQAADPLQEPRHAARRAALDALPRRRVRALVRRHLPAVPLRQGRRGDAGQDVHVQAHGRSRLGRRLALPRPLPVDGGVDRRRHVRRALDRRARRAAAPTASSSSRSPAGTASRRSTAARSSATRRSSARRSGSASSGT